MKDNTTKRIVRTAVIAALYTVLTLVLAPISYGSIQFRISEIMVLLAFFDPFYIAGLTLGCFVANILGPNGMVDAVFGTIATSLSVYGISIIRKHIKNERSALIIASLLPTIFNGLIIGWELYYLYQLPLFLSMLQVAAGEFAVVTIVGVPVIELIKNKYGKLLAAGH
ncbi:MAG: QueT transporter family protein [Clostridium sp.]